MSCQRCMPYLWQVFRLCKRASLYRVYLESAYRRAQRYHALAYTRSMQYFVRCHRSYRLAYLIQRQSMYHSVCYKEENHINNEQINNLHWLRFPARTWKCVGPMKLITPLMLYGRINTDSFKAIQSGKGVSV